MRAWLRGVDDCRAPTNLLPGQSVSECRALRRAADLTLLPNARQAEDRRETAGASSPILPVARWRTGRENGKEKGEQWRRPLASGERQSEFCSALLSPFSTLLLYCRGAAMEAAAKTRNGFRIGTRNVAGRHSAARPGGHLRGVTGRAAALSGVDACRITICARGHFLSLCADCMGTTKWQSRRWKNG